MPKNVGKIVQAAYTYYDWVMGMYDLGSSSMYTADQTRSRLHEELLEVSELSKDDIYDLTVNLKQFKKDKNFVDAVVKKALEKKNDVN